MNSSNFGPLVTTEWLAAHLDDPDLRILESTVHLHPLPGGDMRAESGEPEYVAGHVPGAAFADLIDDLSDPESSLRFQLPSARRFAEAMERLGIGEGTRVVIYTRSTPGWATRVWWMLRAFGFDDAAILDGGWQKWTAEGRPVSTAPASYPPARFVARPREGLFVGKDDVRDALGDGRTAILNALTEEQHAGTGGPHYGRRGRIPGSTCVSARSLVDPTTGEYLPAEQLRRRFADAGMLGRDRVIVYCGGGIAASADAFALTLLGQEGVAVYDASLQEWAKDPALPMESDA